MSTRGLILFKKASDSAAKAAQAVVEAAIFDLYAQVPRTLLESSGTAFAAHVEAGGDWKGWAQYAFDTYDFFIIVAESGDTTFDGTDGKTVVGKGTYGVIDLIDDLGDLLVYYDGTLYDATDVYEVGTDWKAFGAVEYTILPDEGE